jgi:hypothetical protein
MKIPISQLIKNILKPCSDYFLKLHRRHLSFILTIGSFLMLVAFWIFNEETKPYITKPEDILCHSSDIESRSLIKTHHTILSLDLQDLSRESFCLFLTVAGEGGDEITYSGPYSSIKYFEELQSKDLIKLLNSTELQATKLPQNSIVYKTTKTGRETHRLVTKTLQANVIRISMPEVMNER